MKQAKKQWWVVPVTAMGLALAVGFIALVYAYEASDSGEKGAPSMDPEHPASKTKKQKEDRWWLFPLGAMALAILVNLFLLVNAYIPSGSMEPTIPTGALILGDRTAYRRGEPQVGDVVLFRHAELGKKWLVKRVVGLPGQTFSMENGRVYLDGQLLEEDYVTEFSSDRYPKTVIPEDCYLVLGDHRTSSFDSRFWNDPFVHREDLMARALFVYFPRPHLL